MAQRNQARRLRERMEQGPEEEREQDAGAAGDEVHQDLGDAPAGPLIMPPAQQIVAQAMAEGAPVVARQPGIMEPLLAEAAPIAAAAVEPVIAGPAFPPVGPAIPLVGPAVPQVGPAVAQVGPAVPQVGAAAPQVGPAVPVVGPALPEAGPGLPLPPPGPAFAVAAPVIPAAPPAFAPAGPAFPAGWNDPPFRPDFEITGRPVRRFRYFQHPMPAETEHVEIALGDNIFRDTMNHLTTALRPVGTNKNIAKLLCFLPEKWVQARLTNPEKWDLQQAAMKIEQAEYDVAKKLIAGVNRASGLWLSLFFQNCITCLQNNAAGIETTDDVAKGLLMDAYGQLVEVNAAGQPITRPVVDLAAALREAIDAIPPVPVHDEAVGNAVHNDTAGNADDQDANVTPDNQVKRQ